MCRVVDGMHSLMGAGTGAKRDMDLPLDRRIRRIHEDRPLKIRMQNLIFSRPLEIPHISHWWISTSSKILQGTWLYTTKKSRGLRAAARIPGWS